MTSHTPGPWRWEYNKQAKSVYLVGGKPLFDKTVMQFGRWGMNRAVPMLNSQITGNEYNVMERLCDVPDWVKPFPGFEHHASWRMNVTHPDAVLMASAPDLLAALRELLPNIGDNANLPDNAYVPVDMTMGEIRRARAAIAKAAA